MKDPLAPKTISKNTVTSGPGGGGENFGCEFNEVVKQCVRDVLAEQKPLGTPTGSSSMLGSFFAPSTKEPAAEKVAELDARFEKMVKSDGEKFEGLGEKFKAIELMLEAISEKAEKITVKGGGGVVSPTVKGGGGVVSPSDIGVAIDGM